MDRGLVWLGCLRFWHEDSVCMEGLIPPIRNCEYRCSLWGVESVTSIVLSRGFSVVLSRHASYQICWNCTSELKALSCGLTAEWCRGKFAAELLCPFWCRAVFTRLNTPSVSPLSSVLWWETYQLFKLASKVFNIIHVFFFFKSSEQSVVTLTDSRQAGQM